MFREHPQSPRSLETVDPMCQLIYLCYTACRDKNVWSVVFGNGFNTPRIVSSILLRILIMRKISLSGKRILTMNPLRCYKITVLYISC